MSGYREAIRRLGEPDAISWPVFWLSYLINIIISLVAGFDAQVTFGQRILAASAAEITMFSFILLVRAMVLVRLSEYARGWATLVVFLVAGAIRGATVSLVFMAISPSGLELLIPRLPGGLAFGAVVLAPVALAVVTVRSYRRARGALLARLSVLDRARIEVGHEIERRDSQTIDQVRAALQQAIEQDPDAGSFSERLRSFAADVVRPLSHELAAGVPTWHPREAEAGAGRVTVRDVLDRMANGRPFLPIVTTMAGAMLSVSWFVWEEGLLSTVIYVTGGALALVAGLWTANAVLVRVLPGHSLPVRLAMVVLGALGAATAFGLMATLLASSTPWLPALWAASFIFIPVYALILAVGRAAETSLQASLADLQAVDDDLSWQVARIRQVQWSQQRATARALHGPVQAMIERAVAQLGEGDSEADVLNQLRTGLSAALDIEPHPHAHNLWRSTVQQIRSTWAGICEVRTQIDDAAELALDADPVAADMSVEILSEAVSNAVRHGKATAVAITIVGQGRQLEMTIIDNGLGADVAAPGMGTRMLDECALHWSRGRTDGGFVLQLALPVQLAAPAAPAPA